MKAAEYRGMSDEQLDLTLQGHREAPVPAPLPVGHRPAGDAERDPQGAAGHRPDQDDPAAAGAGQATEGSEGRDQWLTRPPRPTTNAASGAPLIGVVTRDKMNKTRRVEIQRLVKHPRYGKYIKQRTICYVHDEKNESHMGDTVEIMETRPLSKTKRWRLVRVVTKAPAKVAARRRRRPREAPHSGAAGDGVNHDPDVYLPGRGRQHRRQGMHVHQGARRQPRGATPAWATSSSPASRRRSPAAT